MTAEPDDLLRIATSISDASADWSELSASAPASMDPAMLRELEAIARIARAHREAVGGPPTHDHAPQSTHAQWGRFALKQELGEGSFGRVYRAHDPRLDRDIALKRYKTAPSRKGDLEALLSEGRLLARVKHANVVVVHSLEAHGDEVGLSMELVEGRTLGEEVRVNGPLGFREAALIALDLCRALSAIHAAGLIHRDVKPQNVMRERGGRIVLMDFGLGREARKSLPEAERVGTPLYMAPEVFEGGQATVASDIYSLGVLLFFMVTNAHPVTARTRTELEAAHRQGRRLLVRDLRPDLPDAFAEVIERATARSPEARFSSAGSMHGALAVALGMSSEEIVRKAEPTWSTWVARSASAAAALLVAVALAIGGFTWYAGRADSQASNNGSAAAPAVASTSPAVEQSAAGAPGQYEIQAALHRVSSPGSTALTAGARVGPGDRLFLEVRATTSVHVYVVNHDERGESYLLFPLPGQPIRNPLPPGTVNRLPGNIDWEVTSVGGREHFLIVASPEPLGPLEAAFAMLPKAQIGRPVIAAAPVPNSLMVELRGIGGLAPQSSPSMLHSDVFSSAQPLSGMLESATGPWIRQLSLENPGR
jgi:serine/threonine protein kinase